MIGKSNKSSRSEASSDHVVNRIAEGTSFEGVLKSENNVRIDGTFEGELTTKGRLVIGATGRVNGNISCAHCEIEGSIEGQIVVQELFVLKSTARVHGEIQYGQLSVENGAQATGNLHLASKVKDMRQDRNLDKNQGESSRSKDKMRAQQPAAV
jgi:cytoskeletal protein CcmA (bactofilin family)